MSAVCPLSGEKRTSNAQIEFSAFDPTFVRDQADEGTRLGGRSWTAVMCGNCCRSVDRPSCKHPPVGEDTRMRRMFACVASCFIVAAATAQVASRSAAGTPDLLSMDQQTKIAQIITKRTTPLPSGAFSIQIDAIVPADIQIHSLPAEAEQLAPRVHGFGYVVVEEQIAIVDLRTRKVELVFPRWGK